MNEETRLRILQKGAEIVHRKGFNHTGIKDILKAAQVPKGSFYYYFESKEDFGLELVEFFARTLGECAGYVLSDQLLSPMQRILRHVDLIIGTAEANGFAKGCPIGNLSQEMGDLSEAFRLKLEGVTARYIERVAAVIEEGQRMGEIRADLDPGHAGRFIVEALQGASIHMKLAKGPEPLETCREMIRLFLQP